MAKRKYVYYSEIDRFGYTLQCIALSEEECKEAMINEYVKTYIKINGEDPREAWAKATVDNECIDDNYAAEDFARFFGELFIEKRELGVVEWS